MSLRIWFLNKPRLVDVSSLDPRITVEQKYMYATAFCKMIELGYENAQAVQMAKTLLFKERFRDLEYPINVQRHLEYLKKPRCVL